MRLTKWSALTAVCGLIVTAGTALAFADTTVEVKGVHLCCPGCVKGVGKALKSVKHVKPTCDQESKTVTIEAKDEAAAQKALDALGHHGYFGDTGSKTLVIKPAEDVPTGKVSTLKLTGVHNCCGACCKAIKAALKDVEGVKADTAKPKSAHFDVTGDFDAADVVKALNKAGFQVKVAK